MQRYVSKELFHFVEKNKEQKDQYNILKKILKECKLDAGKTGLEINGTKSLSSNEVYTSAMVCFCDIPINDLQIHIGKYGNFGLSFSKRYLLSKGASPVWYISKNSTLNSDIEKQNAEYHDAKHKEFHYFHALVSDKKKENPDDHFLETAFSLWYYFESYVFPFMKFFDAEKDDSDKENYYMEREWRLRGSVNFKRLDNIYRIILPPSFSKKFRKDFPTYSGQISFLEA